MLYLIFIVLIGFAVFLCVDLINIIIRWKVYSTTKSILTIYKNALQNFEKTKQCEQKVKLTFNQFYDFYKLNPDKYIFYAKDTGDISPIIKYRIPLNFIATNSTFLSSFYYKDKYLIFFTNYKEFCKYYKWAVKFIKEKNQKDKIEKENNALKNYYEDVQKDIDALKTEAQKEAEKAENILSQDYDITYILTDKRTGVQYQYINGSLTDIMNKHILGSTK